MKTLIATCGIGAAALLLVSGAAQAQPPMLPIGARMTFEVAHPGGPWSSSVAALPGDRIEWRIKVSYTGDNPNVDALGSIYYQPIISGIDNSGAGSSVDQLGIWRNGGSSGYGNTTLRLGMLDPADGNSSNSLASYGRVGYGFFARSSTPGSSGPLTGFRHSAGSGGAPTGDYLRIAGDRLPDWYPSEMSSPPGVALYNNILWGVVSDNQARNSSNFRLGTQDVVIFRHALVLSDNMDIRELILNAEAATLRREGAQTGVDDTRFMNWMLTSDARPGSTGSERVGVDFEEATIIIVPSPYTVALVLVAPARRNRRRHAL